MRRNRKSRTKRPQSTTASLTIGRRPRHKMRPALTNTATICVTISPSMNSAETANFSPRCACGSTPDQIAPAVEESRRPLRARARASYRVGLSGGQRPFRLRRLDLDHFAKAMDRFDGVVEGDGPLRGNELGDLEVVAATFRPHQRR